MVESNFPGYNKRERESPCGVHVAIVAVVLLFFLYIYYNLCIRKMGNVLGRIYKEKCI